jgi:hypothetical protein
MMKFCIHIDYNTDCVLIYLHIFWKLEFFIFYFFLNGGSTGAQEPKAFSELYLAKLDDVTLFNTKQKTYHFY